MYKISYAIISINLRLSKKKFALSFPLSVSLSNLYIIDSRTFHFFYFIVLCYLPYCFIGLSAFSKFICLFISAIILSWDFISITENGNALLLINDLRISFIHLIESRFCEKIRLFIFRGNFRVVIAFGDSAYFYFAPESVNRKYL